MPGALRLRVRYRKYATPRFEYLSYLNEMKKILEGTGWKIKRFLNPKGPAYIAIIMKTHN